MPRQPTEPDGWGEFTPLQEAFAVGPPAPADDGAEPEPKPVVVTLIKAGANASGTTYYTPEFLRQAVAEGHFTGALMRRDHPTRAELMERPEGSLSQVVSRTGDAYWDEQDQSVKAPLVWVAGDVPGSPAQQVKAAFSDPVVAAKAGLSIAWLGDVEYGDAMRTQDGRKLRKPVRLKPRPGDQMYVDFVTSPAAGGAVPHLASTREEHESMEVIADLTLDELTAQRPDLVEAIKAATAAPPPAPDPAPPVDIGAALQEALTPFADRLKALELRAETEAGTDRVNALIAGDGLQESVATIVRCDLSGRAFETDEALQEAYKASVNRVNALLESHGMPRVKDLNGAPQDKPEERPTAADVLRDSGLLPGKE